MCCIHSVAAVLCMASLTHGAYTVAPYTGANWGKTWDFSNDVQGWVPSATGTGVAAWSANYGGSMYFSSDGSANAGTASFSLASLGAPFNNIGSPATGPHLGFILQCDILIPAYTGPGAAGGAHPGVLQGQTVGACRASDGKGPAIGGGTGNVYGARAHDRTWDGTSHGLGYTFGYQGVVQTETWMTLQLDYGYFNPLEWNAWVYNPFPNDRDPASGGVWMQVATRRPASLAVDTFGSLAIGGTGTNGVAAWGRDYIDNVRLRVAPEPATLIIFATGIAFLRRRN